MDENEFYINGVRFRNYDDCYSVSENGDVFSFMSNKFLKHIINWVGHHYVQLHGKNYFVHRLVYMLFNDVIEEDLQINHIDDDKSNNNYKNLYAGTQKENVQDCIRNGHRVGNKRFIEVYDKETDQNKKFTCVKELIDYTGHSVANGSITKMKTKKWFNDRFDIIDYKENKNK